LIEAITAWRRISGINLSTQHVEDDSGHELRRRDVFTDEKSIVVGTAIVVTVGVVIGLLAASPAIIGAWREYRGKK
jgi:hypothetical protein